MISDTHPARDDSARRPARRVGAPPWTLVLEAEPLSTQDEDGDNYEDVGFPILDAGGAALAYVISYPGEDGDQDLQATLAAGALMAEAPALAQAIRDAVTMLNVAGVDLSRHSPTRVAAQLRIETAARAIREVEMELRKALAVVLLPAGAVDRARGDRVPPPPAPEWATHPCGGPGPHSVGEVRVLREASDRVLCKDCYSRELQWRQARNRELDPSGESEGYATPAWQTLPVKP